MYLPYSTYPWSHHPSGPWAVHVLTVISDQFILADQLILSATDVLNWKDEQYENYKPLWYLSFRSSDFEFNTPVERPDAIANPSVLSSLEGNILAGFCSNWHDYSDVPDCRRLAATSDWYSHRQACCALFASNRNDVHALWLG